MSKYRFINRLQQTASGYLNRPANADYYSVERAEWLFYLRYLQPGMTVFDVGANVGQVTLLFSHFVHEQGHVHTFEPSSETFKRLQILCDLAQCSNVTLNHLALADQPGMLTLNLYNAEHSIWNTLAKRPLHDYGIDVDPVSTELVAATTVDSYCEQHAIPQIDLLKIDVEGAEFQVLQGTRRMFTEKRVRCAIFECGQTTSDMGNTPEAIQLYVESVGYRLHNVVKGDPVFPMQGAQPAFAMHVMRST